MTVGTRRLLTVLAAILCLGFLRLGWWQLERAQQKQALLDGHAERTRQPPLNLEEYQPLDRYTPVRISGRYLDYTVLLDNQIRERRLGAHVFTLFEPAGGPPQILINRGWRALAADRRLVGELPPPPAGWVELTGLVSEFPRPGILLGEVDYRLPGTRLVPYLEAEPLGTALKTEIAPQILLLIEDDRPEDAGLIRDWRPQLVPSPQRHRAYAWQWFSLAAAVVVVFIVLEYRRRPQ